MAKYCSNCGNKLDGNSVLCLNCGVIISKNENNTEKKKKFPIWVIILIVCSVIILPIMFIILFMFMIFGITSAYDFEFDMDEYVEESFIQKGTVGDTLLSDDLEITLNDVKKYNSVGEENFKIVPCEGREFLVFFFDVKNISNEKQSIDAYDFSGYVDGYDISNKYVYSDIENVENLNSVIAPGMKTRGYIAFEVDINWNEFEIHYYNFLEEDYLVFSLTNVDNDDI